MILILDLKTINQKCPLSKNIPNGCLIGNVAEYLIPFLFKNCPIDV